MSSDKKPLVGFFPLSYNLAETGRAVMIAKRYKELGGDIVFFSHGGEYEYLARYLECDVVRVEPSHTEDFIERFVRICRGDQRGLPYTKTVLREFVQNEIEAYKQTGVEMIVTTHNYPCSISARAANLPLVSVMTGPGSFHLSFPDEYENAVTRLLPRSVKIIVLNWLSSRSKKFLKPFNVVAREYNIKPFKSTENMANGDVTLVTNFLKFINIFPHQQHFPAENYIGIILLEELFANNFPAKKAKAINDEIQTHLEKSGKSILLSMGSSGDKTLFLNILQILNKTPHKVIAVYANNLKDNELPELNDNILLKKFVPSIAQLHKTVDLAIIHGGQGTVYTAAYAGKPIIGIPMQSEQHLNLEKMVGHGTGLMLSKKYFKQQTLLTAINTIFDNYDHFLKHAQDLAQKLPKPEGDKNAAKQILEIARKN